MVLLSSSPVIPQDKSSVQLLNDYLEWFLQQEHTGNPAWDQDIDEAVRAVFDARFQLKQLHSLDATMFRELGVKPGIASQLQHRIKEFIHQLQAAPIAPVYSRDDPVLLRDSVISGM
jgi:hypothetical protein